MATATMWCIEFVSGSIGVWDRTWFATQPEALALYTRMVEREGYDPDLTDGSTGSITGPWSTDVDLTPEGLLNFANRFAIDTTPL